LLAYLVLNDATLLELAAELVQHLQRHFLGGIVRPGEELELVPPAGVRLDRLLAPVIFGREVLLPHVA